jgi:hypothetical protein
MSAPDKYALASLADGGLLLDLETGGLFQLNATATFVWRRLLDGIPADAIASTIAERHGIDTARAVADVTAALAPGTSLEPPTHQDYHFRRAPSGYVQLFREEPELELDSGGDELVLVASASQRRPLRLRNSLRAIVPKILSLRGQMVIHASAVLARDRLLAFSGESGAGKTTTARALVGRGATLVSEDKLLVRVDPEGALAWRDAEPFMDAWVTETAIAILVNGRASCAALDSSARGDQLPIAELGFLDVATRQGDELVARRLSVPDAAAAAFRCMFLGTDRAAGWRRQLRAAAALAEHVPSYAVTTPEGLPALGRAADALMRTGTLAP